MFLRMHNTRLKVFMVIFALAVAGCAADNDDDDDDDLSLTIQASKVQALYSTSGDAGFFDAPFPIERMRRDDGTVRWELLPNPDNNFLVGHYIDLADAHTQGFSRLGAIYLPFDGAVNADNLPSTIAESLEDGARVFLVNVDPDSTRYSRRVPIDTQFRDHSSTFVPKNVLVFLPYQGRPMAPNAMHAAVVLKSLGDKSGNNLSPADEFKAMARGETPDGEYGSADAEAMTYLWDWCDESGLPRDEIATAAVFRTGDFVSEMKTLRDACANRDDPAPTDYRLLEEFDEFYVIEAKMTMPIWQDGNRPYWAGGGVIHFDEGGPVLQWEEEIRFSVSVPKKPMPPEGYPLLFYANGQGGSYTQVFDRGGIDEAAHIPGTGPGRQFAHRSIACLDFEAATVGPRHPFGSYAGIEFFNFINLPAFRDNLRQAAGEFTMAAKMARHIRIPHELAPEADTGGEDIKYDPGNFYIWGHSTGASIVDLVLAVEPAFRAGMVSGAGVSWIYNLIYKQEPLPLGEIFQLLALDSSLDAFHPLATIFQSICDPAEAAYFAEHWISGGLNDDPAPSVLLIMGIFDRYFPPLMIDGLIAASGVDVAEPLLRDETLEALELSGASVLPLPAGGNAGNASALALQYITPGGVDGHYAPFYLDNAKYQYTCFFKSLAESGRAVIPRHNNDSLAECVY